MPGNGFTLAIRVGCEVDMVCLLRKLLQFRNGFGLAFGNDIVRLEVIVDINTESALSACRKIADMTDGRNDLIVFPEVFLNRIGFGR